MTDVKFEEAIKKLEVIVEELEGGDISLDESLAKYEEGIRLSRICQKKLEVARKKVEILVKSKNGKINLEPFEETDTPRKKAKKKDEETLF